MATAVEYEDRKRPLDATDLASEATSKRPHLDRATSSFVSNGSFGDGRAPNAGRHGTGEPAEEEDDDIAQAYKGLEAFRKEAIFRKLREVQRDLARSNVKLQKLQSQRQESEERCAAFNEFWNVLIEDLRSLVKDSVGQNSSRIDSLAQFSPSAFSLSLHERNASVKAVLSTIVSLVPGSSPEATELQANCHRLAEESAALRGRQARTDAERHELLEELNSTLEQLRRLELQFDRAHSATVRATERSGTKQDEAETEQKAAKAPEEEKSAIKHEEKPEPPSEGASVANGEAVVAAAVVEELENVKQVAESRLRELDQWREQVATLRRENEALRQEAQSAPQERVVGSDLYRELHRLYELANEEHLRLTSLGDRLEAENAELRENRQEFETNAQAEATQSLEELRAAVKGHEADVARLRSQRDEAQADLTERKGREALKFTQIDELKSLVHAKDLRIQTLKSEVRRLQSSWASKNGDTDLLKRLQDGLEETAKQELDKDIEIISDLQARLKAAEETSADLRRQLSARSSSTTEQDLAQQVSKLQKELDDLGSILFEAKGNDAEASSLPRVDDVRAYLRSQREELQQAKGELLTASAGTAALCDELDKLGIAYAEAQNVAASRIAELGRMEEKLARLTTEKAKADNKFFSAMRAKDALENEKRAMSRNTERQLRALEKYGETEKVWQEQMQKHEVEVTALRRFVKEANAKVNELQSRLSSVEESLTKAQQASQAAAAQSEQQTQEYLRESKERLALQERNEKLQRDLDKARKQLAGAAAGGSKRKGGGTSTGSDDQVEFLNALLRCSACADRYRDRIITRCLHTFCHECVDARIQTRQRKCPSCGLGFSTSDVQTLFFQ